MLQRNLKMDTIPSKIKNDIDIIKKKLLQIPKQWDGKKSILELKEADYQWRQMEWWAFYFEYKCSQILSEFTNGDKYNNTKFDFKGNINWDCKAKAVKSDEHKVILNDKLAMEQSIEEHGYHGEIIALCDVEYNDTNRTFQKWHSELKGGKSDYEKARIKRTNNSRYRKTSAEVSEILVILITKNELEFLDIHKQGRNSNGKPRPYKYMLNLEKLDNFTYYPLEF